MSAANAEKKGEKWSLARVFAHVKTLWPRYWALPALPFVLWPLYCISRGERRPELFLTILFGLILPYVSERSKRLYLGILPIGIVGILYDAMRFVKDVGVTKERLHICDIRAIDMSLWSVQVDGRPGTIHDWLQLHRSPALDLYFAVPYGTFIEVAFAFAVYMYFRDYATMRRFTTAFLAMNVLGFLTYHLYPAAPPWYFHSHGCAVDLAAQASEGPNLANVDQILGIAYFKTFYGRSNDVFGAMPSLHVAYPTLITLQGWRIFGPKMRALSAVFTGSMYVAAVYLDHHWVIDVIVGVTYAVVVFFVVEWVFRRAARPRDAHHEVPTTAVAVKT